VINVTGWLIPALRQVSATGVPSSACSMMNAFCASVNFDAFILVRASPAGVQTRKTVDQTGDVSGKHINGEERRSKAVGKIIRQWIVGGMPRFLSEPSSRQASSADATSNDSIRVGPLRDLANASSRTSARDRGRMAGRRDFEVSAGMYVSLAADG